MLDHLLPLMYREFDHFDESNKENLGYVIRRRVRPVSRSVSTTSRTPPRPPRRSSVSTRVEGGVASRRNLKRPRESSHDGNEERGEVKKQAKETPHKTTDRRNLKRPREASDDDGEEERNAKKQVVDREEKKIAAVKEKEKQPLVATDALKEENADELKEKTPAHKDKGVRRSLKRQRESSDDGEEQHNAKKQVVNREGAQVADDLKEEEKVELVTQSAKISAKKVKHKKKTDKKKTKKATRKRIPLEDITHLYVNERTRSYEQQQRERFVAGLTTSVAIRFF